MAKKVKIKQPESWIDWLDTRSIDELRSIAFDQYFEIMRLERLIQHLKTQVRANAVDEYRDAFIEMLLEPDPWDGSMPSDKYIAEKAGTTTRVVREIRNNMGVKKQRGRPKK
jgi:hypothetical protein